MQNALLEHSAILLTYIKPYLALTPIFGLCLEWPLKTGFTVLYLGLDATTPVFGVSDKARLKPVFSTIETS